MNALLIKSYTAGVAIAAYRFVKHGAADNAAIQATDASAAILGISDGLDVAAEQSVDVVKAGLAYLELGGNVTRGDVLIPDANGKGVAAVVVAGTEQHAGAIAEVSGVAGDIIAVQVINAVIATDTSIVQADIVISAAELKALSAAPKQLVAAPGAGKAIVLVDAQAFLDYGTTAYDGIAAGEDLALRYTDGAGAIVAQIEATGFLDAVADAYRHVYPLADAAKTPAANAALVAHMLAGEIATGDSPLKLRVRYRVVDLAF